MKHRKEFRDSQGDNKVSIFQETEKPGGKGVCYEPYWTAWSESSKGPQMTQAQCSKLALEFL